MHFQIELKNLINDTMKWNEMFKILGEKSKSIRQIPNGYSIVLEKRTIFQFKDFSGEFISVDLYKDKMVLIGETSTKEVSSEKWEEMKLFTL